MDYTEKITFALNVVSTSASGHLRGESTNAHQPPPSNSDIYFTLFVAFAIVSAVLTCIVLLLIGLLARKKAGSKYQPSRDISSPVDQNSRNNRKSAEIVKLMKENGDDSALVIVEGQHTLTLKDQLNEANRLVKYLERELERANKRLSHFSRNYEQSDSEELLTIDELEGEATKPVGDLTASTSENSVYFNAEDEIAPEQHPSTNDGRKSNRLSMDLQAAVLKDKLIQSLRREKILADDLTAAEAELAERESRLKSVQEQLKAAVDELDEKTKGEQGLLLELQQAKDNLLQAGRRERQYKDELEKEGRTQAEIKQSEEAKPERVDITTTDSQLLLHKHRNSVSNVIRTLNSAHPPVGVTSLAGHIYVLYAGVDKDHVAVYDPVDFSLSRRLTVPGLGRPRDVAASDRDRCLYISDEANREIFKQTVDGGLAARRWSTEDPPDAVSVTPSDQRVLVTFPTAGKLVEFTAEGETVRTVDLPSDVANPRHGLRLASGRYVVCHSTTPDDKTPLHRVCLLQLSADRPIAAVVGLFGGEAGSGGADLVDDPRHLAADEDGFVYVADANNRRVVLLSPTLERVRNVASGNQLRGRPVRLHLDAGRRRLYVVDVEGRGDRVQTGRVTVFAL